MLNFLGLPGLDKTNHLDEIMAANTGQPLDRIEQDLERDNFMSSEKAVEYGLIDTVLGNRGEMSASRKDESK